MSGRMKYPCVEATIEVPCKGCRVRLWIERPTMLTSQELEEISKLIWSSWSRYEEFEDLVSILVDKIPNLSAAQICIETSCWEVPVSVGQVVYVKDFTTDQHG